MSPSTRLHTYLGNYADGRQPTVQELFEGNLDTLDALKTESGTWAALSARLFYEFGIGRADGPYPAKTLSGAATRARQRRCMTTSSQASKGQHHTPTDEAHNQAPDVVAPRSAPRSTDGAIEPATMICVIDPALDGITSVVAALVASLKSKGVALSIEFQGDLAAEQCHGLTVMARQCAANSAEAGPKHGETVPRSTSLPRIRLVCLRPRNLVDHIKRRLVELVSTTSVVWFVPHNTDMTSFDQFTARLLEAIEPSIKRLSLINVVSARDTLQARRSSHLEILRAPATGAGWKTGIFRPLPLAIQQAFEQAPFPLMELPRFGPADVAKRLGRRPANANRDFHAFASFLSEAKHAFDEADLLPKRQKGKVQ